MGVSELLLPKGPLIDEFLVLPRTSLSRLPNASFTKTQTNKLKKLPDQKIKSTIYRD